MLLHDDVPLVAEFVSFSVALGDLAYVLKFFLLVFYVPSVTHHMLHVGVDLGA